MLKHWFNKKKIRQEAINKAREGFVSWLEVSKSLGYKIYQERVDKKIEFIKNKIENDTTLTGEDLKRLQLALQVWKEVQRIPKELEENAMGGLKK